MKKSKRILVCLIACLAVTMVSPSVHAAGGVELDTIQNEIVTPRFQHMSRISSSLSISDAGLAVCGGSFTTYDEYDSSMTIQLQQFKNLEWVEYKTWSDDYTGSGIKVLEKSFYVPHGYNFQLVTTVTIWDSDGNAIEVVSCNSPIKSY